MGSSMKKESFMIRTAREEDAEAILKIYSPHIVNSVTSFEYELPTVDEIKRRIRNTLTNYPWLVYETEDGTVAGYSYASQFNERPGYQWAVQTAIYVAPNFASLGIGKKLYSELFRRLIEQGYFKATATIGGNNEGSNNFHLKMGYQFVGKFEKIGWKCDQWVDVNSYVKELQELRNNPSPPIPYPLLQFK